MGCEDSDRPPRLTLNPHLERELFLGRLFLQFCMLGFLLACLVVQRRADRGSRLTFESPLLLLAQSIVAGLLLLEWLGEASGRGFPLKQLLVFALPWWGAYGALRHFQVRGDRVLLPLACSLTGLGWVQILRIDFVLASKQAIWLLASLTLFSVVAIGLRDYQRLRRFALPLLILAVALQAGVLFVGTERNGARLWYSVGSMLFQPVEVVKVLAVLILSAYLAPLLESEGTVRRRTLAAFALGWGATEALLVLEKDLGAALLFFGIFLAIFYVSTGRVRWVLGVLGLFCLGAAAGYALFPHVRVRFQAWADPLGHFNDSGYQICQALFALAWGGPWGVGPGMGDPARIPEAATDFIFVSFCEEMGGVGGTLMLASLAFLVFRALRAARRCANPFGRLMGVGLATVLAWQTLILVYGTLKLAPMTGVTVPFVSYGGSSLMANFLILALLQRLTQTPAPADPEASSLRVRWLTWLALALFLPPVLQLWHYQVWEAAYLNGHRFNSRRTEKLEYRGQILDRRGTEMAGSRGARRYYPLAECCGPLVGYADLKYGVAGVESWCDTTLRGEPPMHGLRDLLNASSGRTGENVTLTIDNDLQLAGFESLEGRTGALIVLSVPKGEVLAAVSRPTFDPNRLAHDWKRLSADPQAPLLDRAEQGLYAHAAFEFPLLPPPPLVRRQDVPNWAVPQVVRDVELVSPLHVAYSALAARVGQPVLPHMRGLDKKTTLVVKGKRPARFSVSTAQNPDGHSVSWGVGLWPEDRPRALFVLVLEDEADPAAAHSVLDAFLELLQ